MKIKPVLYICMALLVALCMTASACYVCGSVDPSKWRQLDDKKPGDVVHLSVPSQAGMTYKWVQNVKDLDTGVITTTTITDSTHPTWVDVTVSATCNIEIGIVVTISNQNEPACALAKCVWWSVPCPRCPTLPNFCQTKATQAQADIWNVPGYSETWQMPKPTVFDPTLTNLNNLAPGTYTAYMFIGTKEVCNKGFTVFALPADFEITSP
ncbi:MAG: hypothetical protein NTY37_12700 [Methanothrix sp.]|nr:hypothetical protein [Methanothrix sp.]